MESAGNGWLTGRCEQYILNHDKMYTRRTGFHRNKLRRKVAELFPSQKQGQKIFLNNERYKIIFLNNI